MCSLFGRSVGQSEGESLGWLVGFDWLLGRWVVRSVGLSSWFGFVRWLVGWFSRSVGLGWVGVGLGSVGRLVCCRSLGGWVCASVGCI